MKWLKEHTVIVVLVAIGVLFFIMWLRKSDKPPVDYKEIIKAQDETIKTLRESRDRERQLYDLRIADHLRDDSILQLKDKSTIVKYATIPVYVNNLGRDSLRAEVLRFSK
jgi:hypothetical protein